MLACGSSGVIRQKEDNLITGILVFIGLTVPFSWYSGGVSLGLITSCFLISSMEEGSVFWIFHLDEVSVVMEVLLGVLFSVILVCIPVKQNFALCLSLFICFLFFVESNPFHLFVLFEASVIPLLFIISQSGNSPERVGAAFYIVLFTLILSLPLFSLSLFLESEGEWFPLQIIFSENMGEKWVFLAMFAFFVNIPIYLFHSWLPRAHVEAPLEGSILLAGVMLNLGLFGVIRFSSILSQELLSSIFTLGLVGSVITFLLALASDDLNKSVAYSSIAHINFAISALLSFLESSNIGVSVVMFTHAFGASLLFWLVTNSYLLSGSRSLLVSNGILSKVPFFQLASFLLWSSNISPPPSVAFLAEMSMISSIVLFSGWLVGVLFCFLFLSVGSIFSITNYAFLSHSSSKKKSKYESWSFSFLGVVSWFVIISILLFIFPTLLF